MRWKSVNIRELWFGGIGEMGADVAAMHAGLKMEMWLLPVAKTMAVLQPIVMESRAGYLPGTLTQTG